MTYQVLKPHYRIEECLEEIRKCLEVGWTGEGFKTLEFEEAWKTYTGLPNAYFVNSATSGLHLAIRILKDIYGWNDGDQVITTPFTFISTTHAIKYENLFPRFADIDSTLTLDPNSVRNLINNKTVAIMFVGVGGNVGNLEEILKLAKEKELPVILDASHMSGTRWLDGTHVGNRGEHVSIFSFHSVKNLPTADGGMICFRDKDLDQYARQLAWLGIDKHTHARTSKESYKWRYDVDTLGYKYHGNSVMASLGLVGLRHLEEDNEYRRLLAKNYDLVLKDIPNKLQVIEHKNCKSSRHLYQVSVHNRNRDVLIDELNLQSIYPGVHYITNNSYDMYKYDFCPISEYFSNNILSLPLHLELSIDDVIKIGEVIAKSL